MTARWAQSKELLWRRAGDRILLLRPIGDKEIVSLSGTAMDLWLLIGEPRSISELSEVLARRYGADTETVSRDVEAFFEDLGQRGLVEEVR